jgi:hypothetical protein
VQKSFKDGLVCFFSHTFRGNEWKYEFLSV